MESQDPAVVFCEGVMMLLLSKLDVRSLTVARLVNKHWLTLASTEQLWELKCEELWRGKAHIPRISKLPGLSFMEATLLSIKDSKRTRITGSDLHDHAWDFRCSEEDQARRGPRRRYFQPDGRIMEGDGERVWSVVNGSTYTMVVKEETGEQLVRINSWPQSARPHLSVVRRPDWGWELSDHLYCYSSIPDAEKVKGTGPFEF